MTCAQFNALPDQLRRRDVLVLLNWDERTLEAVTREVESAAEVAKLPPRTIAAIRPVRQDGRQGRRFYFKSSMRVFMSLTLS